MRHLFALTAAALLLPTMAGATTYACHQEPQETGGPVTMVTMTTTGVAIRAGDLAYTGDAPSKTLPDVAYFARMTDAGPTWGAHFTKTGQDMYRYTLDLATGDLRYQVGSSSKVAGRCFVLSDS